MFKMNAKSYIEIPEITRADLQGFLQANSEAIHWAALFKKYNGIFVAARKKKILAINDPQAIAHVLKDPHDAYDKNFSVYNRMKFLLGDGLLTRMGDVWRERRKLCQPHFTHHVMPEVGGIAIEKTLEMIQRWRECARKREVINLNEEFLVLALQISSQALLHCAFDYEKTLSIVRTFGKTHMGIQRAISLNPYFPSITQWLGRWRLNKVKKIVKEILTAHRTHSSSDLADTLLSQTRCPFAKMSEYDVEEEIRTFLGAGHDTTASSLMWTMVNLLQHPHYLARAQHEAATVLSSRDPVYEDIDSFTFTKMAWQESMRLYPPIWMTGRHSIKADMLLDYEIPQDSTVLICLYALHRHQHYWSDPEIFNPYRFTREAIAARDKFAYLPFGAGGHVCIAQLFATTQAPLILATILRHFDFELLSNDFSHQVLFTIHPKYPVYVRVKER